MGIWERLGNVIKSYLNSSGERIFSQGEWNIRDNEQQRHSDPYLNAAYEELDDFLKGDDKYRNRAYEKARKASEEPGVERKPLIPEHIRRDLAKLGLAPEASAEDCKEAYKKLLKVHHPDRHTKHEGNMKKATEKTARVNAAYERLMEWFRE